MGVHGQMKSKKKTMKQKKAMKWRRGQRTEAKKKHVPELNLEEMQLFSKDMVKNKLKNLKNNINLSNKKKNRLLKRLRHGKRDLENKNLKEEEDDVMQDGEMAIDDDDDDETSSPSDVKVSETASEDISETSTVATGSGKKGKKKKGKKQNLKFESMEM